MAARPDFMSLEPRPIMVLFFGLVELVMSASWLMVGQCLGGRQVVVLET